MKVDSLKRLIYQYLLIAFLLLITLPKFVERGGDSDLTTYKTIGAFILIFGIAGLKKLLYAVSIEKQLLLTFIAFCFISSAWSVDPIITIRDSAILFLFMSLCIEVISTIHNSKTYCIIIFGSLFILLCDLYAIHEFGVGVGRYVGNVSPNHIAGIAVAAFLLLFVFSENLILMFLTLTLAIIAVLLVDSRGGLAQIMIVVSMYAYKKYKLSIPNLLYLIIVVVSLSVLLAVYSDYVLLEVLKINDAERGVSTGGTGRDAYILRALPSFIEHFLLGNGFGVANSDFIPNAHNGFINIFIEVGIIGGLLFLGLLLFTVIKGFKSQSIFVNKAAITVLSISLLALLEVHLLNVGFIMGALFVLTMSICIFINGNEGV